MRGALREMVEQLESQVALCWRTTCLNQLGPHKYGSLNAFFFPTPKRCVAEAGLF
jgi:hypothetical protein